MKERLKDLLEIIVLIIVLVVSIYSLLKVIDADNNAKEALLIVVKNQEAISANREAISETNDKINAVVLSFHGTDTMPNEPKTSLKRK